MKAALKAILMISPLLLSGCQTATGFIDLGQDADFIEASDLDESGKRTEAFTLFLKLAQNENFSNSAAVWHRVAKGYLEGDGVKKDISKAIFWNEKLAKIQDKSWAKFAHFDLGFMYMPDNPYGIQPDILKSYGHFQACAQMGAKYCKKAAKKWAGHPVVYISQNKDKFIDRSDKILSVDIDQGFKLFSSGKRDEAFDIFLQHARRGNVSAQESIAVYYKEKLAQNAKPEDFLAWTYLAARNGSKKAQFEMGLEYRDGPRIRNSDEEAVKWFLLAANQGNAEAMNSIGSVYAHPYIDGIQPDYSQSFKYFRQAAENGSINGLINFADSYLKGMGVDIDKSKAKKLYLQAAEQGNVTARKRLLEFFDLAKLPERKSEHTKSQQTSATRIVEKTIIEERIIHVKKQQTEKTPVELFSELNGSVYLMLAGSSQENVMQGSAVALTKHLAITNCHVLDDKKFYFTKVNGEFSKFDLVRSHEDKDLCLIRSELPLSPIKLTRKYSDLKIGERVYAIGSPRGLHNTLSEGIVSGLRTRNNGREIQTTTPISPGSSGGGLFDTQGRLIGITTKGFGEGSLNFAVALEEAFPLPR